MADIYPPALPPGLAGYNAQRDSNQRVNMQNFEALVRAARMKQAEAEMADRARRTDIYDRTTQQQASDSAANRAMREREYQQRGDIQAEQRRYQHDERMFRLDEAAKREDRAHQERMDRLQDERLRREETRRHNKAKEAIDEAKNRIEQTKADRGASEKAGVHRLPDGSTVSDATLMARYRQANNLMDPLQMPLMERFDPRRAAAEREKADKALPFDQWVRREYGIDVKGGYTEPGFNFMQANDAAVTGGPAPGGLPPAGPPAAAPGRPVAPAGPGTERRQIGGKWYVKQNGKWYEE